MQRSRSLLLLIFASVLLLGRGTVVTVHAQDREHEESCHEDSCPGKAFDAEGAGHFAIGVQFADLGPLNNRLSNQGYPTFPLNMVLIGGGGYGVANRILLGGEGHGLLTENQGSKGRNVSVGGGYGLFTLGYLFRPTSNLRVYPQVGLGGGGVRLEIGNQGTATDFEDILDDPDRGVNVGRSSLLVSLGGGLAYQFSGPDEHGGLRLGLRAGYMLSALSSDWKLNDTTFSGGPDAAIQGPFIHLTIGGGGAVLNDDEDE